MQQDDRLKIKEQQLAALQKEAKKMAHQKVSQLLANIKKCKEISWEDSADNFFNETSSTVKRLGEQLSTLFGTPSIKKSTPSENLLIITPTKSRELFEALLSKLEAAHQACDLSLTDLIREMDVFMKHTAHPRLAYKIQETLVESLQMAIPPALPRGASYETIKQLQRQHYKGLINTILEVAPVRTAENLPRGVELQEIVTYPAKRAQRL